MFTYRRIEDSETHFIDHVWSIEQTLPEVFRDASRAWTPDIESWREFWGRCEVWGLFDGDELGACVYLEPLGPRAVNIHISVLKKCPQTELVRFFRSLTAHKAGEGLVSRTAWILERNRALLRIAELTGYEPTGLKMDFGASRGRLLRWVQFRG